MYDQKEADKTEDGNPYLIIAVVAGSIFTLFLILLLVYLMVK